MKRISFILALALMVSMLAGCAGTPVVYYTNCTCPVAETPEAAPQQTVPVVEAPQAPAAEGALKTGLAIAADLTDNSNATADSDGAASFDVTFAAVTVDEAGVIQDCLLDSLGTSVTFDAKGTITSDPAAPVQTKNELGEAYGMKAYAGSQYEWNEQAAAVAAFAVGKTAQELKTMAVDETGHAADADLATTATIYIGGYVDAIVKAVQNAQALGAEAGDTLKLAILPSLSSTTAPTAEKDGTAQLDCDVAAVTMNGDTITSCYIDALQVKVNFTTTGEVTTEPATSVPTKNELGEQYGMKAYAGSAYEWNEQAASFAAYVTGKTPAEVAGIAVNEATKPEEADLAATVTIAIGGFQALIDKAAQ